MTTLEEFLNELKILLSVSASSLNEDEINQVEEISDILWDRLSEETEKKDLNVQQVASISMMIAVNGVNFINEYIKGKE